MLRHFFKIIPKKSNLITKFNAFRQVSASASSFSTQKRNKETQQSDGNYQFEGNRSRSTFDIFKKIAFLMCAGVIGGFLGYVVFGQEEVQITKTEKQQPKAQEKAAKAVKLGGEWQLINTQGNTFSSSELAGSFYLIYFGYALCPDICPTTLNYLSNVNRHLKNIEQGKGIDLKIIFVSVDPKRDSPQSIRNYLNLFDSSIIGLTGKDQNDEEYKNMLKSFKVYANKMKNQDGNTYNIDHTSIVFLMDPKNQYVGSINPSKSQKQTALFLINKIKTHQESPFKITKQE